MVLAEGGLLGFAEFALFGGSLTVVFGSEVGNNSEVILREL